jgi:tRNA/rRNA methyltransferase
MERLLEVVMSRKSHPPAVVLVRPQLAENIGAAARAMANFGVRELRLVDPRPFDETLAARTACDGRELLQAARTFPDLKAAVADCALVIGSTRRARHVKLEAVTPAEAAQRLTGLPPAAASALVFGAEAAGLTNEELYLCDLHSTIPVAEFGSLNLSQAVLVYLYAWFQSAPQRPELWKETTRPATHAEKQRVYDLFERILVAAQYKPLSRLPEFLRRVKLLFEDRPLSEREQRILLKMLRYFEKLV